MTAAQRPLVAIGLYVERASICTEGARLRVMTA